MRSGCLRTPVARTLVVGVLLLSGCTSGGAAPSSSSSSARSATAPSPGLSAAASSSSPGAGVTLSTAGELVAVRQTPDEVSARSAGSVAAILTDLETFWSAQLGGAFTRPSGGYLVTDTADLGGTSASTHASSTTDSGTPGATDSSTGSAPPSPDTGCAGSVEALRGNAFYCPDDDSIVIDAGALVPVLSASYGIGGLAAALAHEYGHLVQARIGPTPAQQHDDPERYPQVLIEAQADCAAGAYLRWATRGAATPAGSTATTEHARLQIPPQDLAVSVAPLVDFRDSTTASTNDLFHGYGMDRLRPVIRGWEQGARSCAAMTVADLDLTLGRRGTVAPGAPRYPDEAAVISAAGTAVRGFDAGSPAAPATNPSAAELSSVASIGQFAQAGVLVLQVGKDRTGDDVGASCYLGAFTAHRYGHSQPGGLGTWRGDADEAMDLVMLRARTESDGWARIRSFVHGFAAGNVAGCR